MIKFKSILPSIFLLFFLFVLFFTIFYIYDSPYDVIISDVTNSSAVVSWKTKRSISSHVKLEDSTVYRSLDKSKLHRVQVNNLEERKIYSFSISDGFREWKKSIFWNSKELEQYTIKEFTLETEVKSDLVQLPIFEEIIGKPNELIYLSLYNRNSGESIKIKSINTNRYGGGVLNIENEKYEYKDIQYSEVIEIKREEVSGVKISNTGEQISEAYFLKEGVNFIGLDFNSTISASNLINVYPQILLIGEFKNNEWENILKKSDTIPYLGNDFLLEQGRGYLVISEEGISMNLEGYRDASISNILEKGSWNLVGGSEYTNYQLSSDLISYLKEQGIKSDTVAIWSNSIDRFEYRIQDLLDIYGDDISLSENMGIFLRVND